MCCISARSMYAFYIFVILYTLLTTGTITSGIVFDNVGEIIGGSIAAVVEIVFMIVKYLCCRCPECCSNENMLNSITDDVEC